MTRRFPLARGVLLGVGHGSLWLTRMLLWSTLILATFVLVGAAILRYVLLPNIDDYRAEIAAAISRAANQRVTIGAVAGVWDGVRPRLSLRDVRVFDGSDRERLALAAIDAQLSWSSLIALEPRFRSIRLEQLSFEVRRDADGRFWIAGMPLQQGDARGSFGDWLLEQDGVGVYDSTVTWVDETLGGEPLVVRDTDLQVRKRLGTWRFAVRAVPPDVLAGPIDLRGDLTRDRHGPSVRWSGRLYFRMGYADLAALRRWITMPIDFGQGAGSVEAWSTIEDGQMRGLTADVALSNVRLRLRQGLPELGLARMAGRLSWQQTALGTRIGARQLSFTTPDGLRLLPADVSYGRSGREGAADTRSYVRFDRLDVAALMRLLDRLPLDEVLRERLSDAAPSGTVRDFELQWVGPFRERRGYQLRAQFERLGLYPTGYLPGFAAVSGSVEATDQGGVVALRTGKSAVDMPRVFAGTLPLESLDARVTWTMAEGSPLIRIAHAVFANAHLAGQVAGSYRVVPGQPGTMDLSGTLSRGDAREVWRYIPLLIHERIRDWLKDGLIAGHSEDVRFRLRGDLRSFPFVDPATGIFEVVTRFRDGALAYVPEWPVIEDASGELVFRAASMNVTVPHARVFGTQLRQVVATIPRLNDVGRQMLQVRGIAEGPSQDFLRFIEESAVERWIGGFTRGMRASGSGTLQLALDIPLHRMADASVRGSYRFAGNVLEPGHGAPRLEELTGELQFTERDVRVRDTAVRVLGMPARLSAQRQGNGVLVQGRGWADTAAVRALLDHQAALRLSGRTAWQATAVIGGGGYDLKIDSDLRGLTSSLPAPFGKDATRALPFRYQRHSAPGRDLTVFSLGSVLSAQLERDPNGGGRIARGELRVNAVAPVPRRDGVWLSGAMSATDLDAWHALLTASAGKDGGDADGQLAGVSLQVGTLRAWGRDWSDVRFGVSRTQSVWRGRIDARQAVGTFEWTASGDGALAARLQKLHVPESPARLVAPGDGPARLPALDIVAEDFRLEGRELGRMTLLAGPERGDWRIRRFEAVNAHGTLQASGTWEQALPTPVTHVELVAETGDIGAYLASLKLPPGVVGGSATMKGRLAWAGAPQAFDLPSLGGSLQLTARKGRFAKAEPGIGKLFGVISLQALPRRVALDFNDVFSEGFAFDSIAASIAIENGVASTENFRMIGPAARVEMRGEVNLSGETQRLDVKVLPALSESVALGAAFLNPAIGIAALLAQKALNDPINQLAAFEYEVSGTWTEPMVLKKRRDDGDESRPGRQ